MSMQSEVDAILAKRAANRAKKESKKNQRPSRGAAREFVGGVRRGYAQLFVDALENAQMSGVATGPSTRMGADINDDGRYTIAERTQEKSFELQRTREMAIERTGEPDPVDGYGRWGERFGKTLPYLAAGWPLAMQYGPAAFAYEVAFDLISTAAGEGVSEATGSDAAGLTAEIIFAMAVPGVAASKTRKVINEAGELVTEIIEDAPNRISRKARRNRAAQDRRMGEKLWRSQQADNVKPFDMSPEDIRRLASEYGVPQERLRQAVAEIKRKFDVDPVGGREATIRGATEEIERGLRDFPDPATRPNTLALMGDFSNENLEAMLKRLSSTDQDFSAELGGIYRATKMEMDRKFRDLQSGGSFAAAKEQRVAIQEIMDGVESKMWEIANLEELPTIDVTGLRKKANDAINKARGIKSEVPEIARVIANLPDRIDAAHFQDLRSSAVRLQRRGKKSLDVPIAAQAENIRDVVTEMNRIIIEDMPDEGSRAYRRALAMTRRNHKVFDSKAADAFRNFDSAESAVGSLKRGKNIVQNAKDAVELFSLFPDSGGLENLRAAAESELFASEMMGSTKVISPYRVLGKIYKARPFYEEIFGKKNLDEWVGFVKRVEKARRSIAGTAAATRVTGSNVNPVVEALFATADVVTSPVQTAGVALAKRALRKNITDNKDIVFLQREMLKNGELAIQLINIPEPEAVARWVVEWNLMIGRARIARMASEGSMDVSENMNSGRQVTTPLPTGR